MQASGTTQPSSGNNHQQSTTASTQNPKQSKVMITGDDILIEYVSRLTKTLNCLKEDLIEHS